MSKMREPILDKLPITDEGLKTLAGLRELRSLPLNRTKVTDAGLAHLVDLPFLSRLDLAETAVSDAGLVHLERIVTLKSLNVQGTGLTEAGARRLCEALPNCRVTIGQGSESRTFFETGPTLGVMDLSLDSFSQPGDPTPSAESADQ